MTEDELIIGLKMEPKRRVVLPEWNDEGRIVPRETGIVLIPEDPVENGMLIVEVDESLRDGTGDDCLRELSVDQIEWETP